LWRLVPILRGEQGFRHDRQEWNFRAVKVELGDTARAILVLHFPLLASSPLLNRSGTDMCQTYKILLSILCTAGIDPTSVFFTDSLPIPSDADVVPSSSTTTATRQNWVDALNSLACPKVYMGDHSDLNIGSSLLFGHPIALAMCPTARTAVAQALSSSNLDLKQLQSLADAAYQAFLDDCARVCSQAFLLASGLASECYGFEQGGREGGRATQDLIRRYLAQDLTLTDKEYDAADRAYRGRCTVHIALGAYSIINRWTCF
jgi:hypothetical protein